MQIYLQHSLSQRIWHRRFSITFDGFEIKQIFRKARLL
jgi:hypothetical protein